MNEPWFMDNVNERGQQLKNGLLKLQDKYRVIEDIRGLGLMIGVEFSKTLPYGFNDKVSKECAKNGMLLLTTSIYNTLRFIPPLTVTAEEIQTALKIFELSLNNVLNQQ